MRKRNRVMLTWLLVVLAVALPGYVWLEVHRGGTVERQVIFVPMVVGVLGSSFVLAASASHTEVPTQRR
jgi:TctA family transporter